MLAKSYVGKHGVGTMKTKVTLADVASEAGVSTQTVSRAINDKGEISEETRQRVLQVAQRLGFRPNRIARSLVTDQTMILGLIVPDITNPFFSEIALGAGEQALSQGYNLIVLNTIENPEREEALFGVMEETRVDGVIVCSPRLAEERLVPLLSRQKAAILVNRSVLHQEVGSICIDDFEGSFNAMQHLFSRNRRKIGFIAGPAQSFAGRNRSRGYHQAFVEAGLKYPEGMQIHCGPMIEDGKEASITLLQRHPDIEGLLCYNDLIAIGALQACAELNISVPDQVAVIGFDDILLGRLMSPKLTTLRVSKREIGIKATEMLLAQIRGQGRVEDILVKEGLVIRESAP